jgi:hypothetical protein
MRYVASCNCNKYLVLKSGGNAAVDGRDKGACTDVSDAGAVWGGFHTGCVAVYAV